MTRNSFCRVIVVLFTLCIFASDPLFAALPDTPGPYTLPYTYNGTTYTKALAMRTLSNDQYPYTPTIFFYNGTAKFSGGHSWFKFFTSPKVLQVRSVDEVFGNSNDAFLEHIQPQDPDTPFAFLSTNDTCLDGSNYQSSVAVYQETAFAYQNENYHCNFVFVDASTVILPASTFFSISACNTASPTVPCTTNGIDKDSYIRATGIGNSGDTTVFYNSLCATVDHTINGNPDIYDVRVLDGCSHCNIYGYGACQGSASVAVPIIAWVTPRRKPFVVFFPGFAGSRLWRDTITGEDQLWVPTALNLDIFTMCNNVTKNDLCALRLSYDELHPGLTMDYLGIYTKSREAGGLIEQIGIKNGPRKDIYAPFIKYLNELKDNGTIAGFQAIPYDWRLDVDDIAFLSQVPGGDNTNIIDHIKALRDRYGPITIIGHSNGGLVAKAVLDRLEVGVLPAPLSNYVSRAVLIATPQLGTPKAIVGLLHGDFAPEICPGPGSPWYSVRGMQAPKREAAETMPGAYGLLPSQAYFGRVPGAVVRFEESTRPDKGGVMLRRLRLAYGENVSTYEEFSQFLSGQRDGRKELRPNAPFPNDLDSCLNLPTDEKAQLTIPNTAKLGLVERSRKNHVIWDKWSPPPGVTVNQIAGINKITPRRIVYKSKRCSLCEVSLYYDYDYGNGDGTVLRQSALGMVSGAGSSEVDLKDSKHDHMSMLSAPDTQKLITSILITPQGVTAASPKRAKALPTTASPELSYVAVRLRAGPAENYVATVSVADMQKRRAGLLHIGDSDEGSVIQEIPGSTVEPVAGHQTITLITNRDYRLQMNGRRPGAVTLEVLVHGRDEKEVEWVFRDIKVGPAAVATLSLSADGYVGELDIDMDGDGGIDTYIVPTPMKE